LAHRSYKAPDELAYNFDVYQTEANGSGEEHRQVKGKPHLMQELGSKKRIKNTTTDTSSRIGGILGEE
jgi:hypothetical protein